MVLCLTGDKPLSEPMMVKFTDVYILRDVEITGVSQGAI